VDAKVVAASTTTACTGAFAHAITYRIAARRESQIDHITND